MQDNQDKVSSTNRVQENMYQNILAGTRFFAQIQTGAGAYQASYTMGNAPLSRR